MEQIENLKSMRCDARVAPLIGKLLLSKGDLSLGEIVKFLPESVSKWSIKNELVRLSGKKNLVERKGHYYRLTDDGQKYFILFGAILPSSVGDAGHGLVLEGVGSSPLPPSDRAHIEQDILQLNSPDPQIVPHLSTNRTTSEYSGHLCGTNRTTSEYSGHLCGTNRTTSEYESGKNKLNQTETVVDVEPAPELERPWPASLPPPRVVTNPKSMNSPISCSEPICLSWSFKSVPMTLMFWKDETNPPENEYPILSFLLVRYKSGVKEYRFSTEEEFAKDCKISPSYQLQPAYTNLLKKGLISRSWGKDDLGRYRIAVKREFIARLHSDWHRSCEENPELQDAFIAAAGGTRR